MTVLSVTLARFMVAMTTAFTMEPMKERVAVSCPQLLPHDEADKLVIVFKLLIRIGTIQKGMRFTVVRHHP
ncbi:hypothetical protein O162_30800 [Pseudomonas putida SJ3]|nr:hypothetical protein O162_30800 [Pseudomonas putida SJ3]